MKHKFLLITGLILITYSCAFAQNPEWLIYNSSNSPLPDEGIYEIEVESLSKFWVGTYGYGIYHFDNGNWLHYDSLTTGLSINNTFNIEIDNNNNKWFGSFFPGGDGGNGLFRFDGNNWTHFTTSNSGLGGDGICNLKIDNNGLLWIGHNNGISTYDGQNWNNISLDSEFQYVVAIAIENNENFWFGTNVVFNNIRVGGLYKYNPNTGNFQKYNIANSGLPHNFVFGIDFDNDGNKWIATYGGAAKFDGTTNWITYNINNTNYVSDVKVDSNNDIWFATFSDAAGQGGGIAFYDGSVWITYDTSNSELTSNNSYRIEIDENGNKYFTCGNGICIFNENGINDVKVNNNLPEEFQLLQNYPNPFNPVTKISWQSPVGSHQILKVYDMLGNEIATLVNEYRPAGSYELEFDASSLTSGVYFYQLKAGAYVATRKMILLK
jgi:ligand-binding sensor domain-containing protein